MTSLPQPSAPRKGRGSTARKNRGQVFLFEDEDRSDARRAVQRAAQIAVDAALENPTSSTIFAYDTLESPLEKNTQERQQQQQQQQQPQGLPLRGQSSSVDFFENDSHSSYFSQERATFRGSKRGIFEENEIGIAEDDDRDVTTAAETRLSTISGRKKKKKKSRKSSLFRKDRFQGLPQLGVRINLQEISKEAWMCGVCAKSFSSFETAKKHEDYHIKEVVMDLGWVCNTAVRQRNSDSVNVPTFFQQTTPRGSAVLQDQRHLDVTQHINPDRAAPYTPAAQRTVSEKVTASGTSAFGDRVFDSVVQPPRPDVLTVSKAARTPSRMNLSMQQLPPLLEKKRFGSGFTARDLIFDSSNPSNDLLAEHDLLVPHGMRDCIILADEALMDVCSKAEKLVLSQVEQEAEFELECYSKDKHYYDMLEQREIARRSDGAYSRFRTEGKNIAEKIQNKFVDAYALMKEGKSKSKMMTSDHYNRKLKGDADIHNVINNTEKTLYVNVFVKNSIQVVSHELERLARQRWEEYKANNEGLMDSRNEDSRGQFEKFKAAAQGNLVKLAGLALASDFTPRRIAVQLSNDLYRLLTPRLKRRGVFIETEIEYRVGPYFVLAVNVLRVDWRRLLKMTNRDVADRSAKWKREAESEDAKEGVTRRYGPFASFIRLTKMTTMEILAQFLAWLYYTHWAVYTPVCWFLYHFAIGETFRLYFLTSVTDEIFYYVEQKGMEMDINMRDSQTQAAFMLSALQEIRADGRELKKKQKEVGSEDQAELLGPLLGPAIKEDSGPAPSKPDGFETPENLEFVGLELNLRVGFRRLRWAILSSESSFISEAVFKAESSYENISMGKWNKHDNVIGAAKSPVGVNEADYVGAEKEMSYLMPKSVFVKANMAYETAYILAYNDYCFVLKKRALTPDVPYGSTFEAWTQYVVINTGPNSCKMICSVEAEFPNGPPMISRQITSGMRAGVGELFVKTGETIEKYANSYP